MQEIMQSILKTMKNALFHLYCVTNLSMLFAKIELVSFLSTIFSKKLLIFRLERSQIKGSRNTRTRTMHLLFIFILLWQQHQQQRFFCSSFFIISFIFFQLMSKRLSMTKKMGSSNSGSCRLSSNNSLSIFTKLFSKILKIRLVSSPKTSSSWFRKSQIGGESSFSCSTFFLHVKKSQNF